MKIKVVVHEAEEGGYWAEVPATPGCATQGETMDELLANVHEAVEARLRRLSASQGGKAAAIRTKLTHHPISATQFRLEWAL
ncbi:MAG TPA: type II toxin-antitoxin system HicB family antitoxin [Terriglobia bacterium]|nr:type II toxin-antitoxin system HicB family antitoxin [Terriglobia bacterium]